MIGIIGAMESEVSTLKSNIANCKITNINSLSFYSGTLSGKEVVVVRSGVGKVNAALCAQLLIIKFGVDKIINTGIAGAMGGDLDVFDFVVSSKTVYHDVDATGFGYSLGQVPGMDIYYDADSNMASAALDAFSKTEASKEHKMLKGLIASGDQFIDNNETKENIKKNFAPLCVEMEGCAIAQACSLNRVPFVIIRCMSDTADEHVKSTYTFNEGVCAEASAKLILEVVKEL